MNRQAIKEILRETIDGYDERTTAERPFNAWGRLGVSAEFDGGGVTIPEVDALRRYGVEVASVHLGDGRVWFAEAAPREYEVTIEVDGEASIRRAGR